MSLSTGHEILDFLSTVSLFQDFDQKKQIDLTRRFKELSLRKGQLLFAEDDPGDYFYLILTGKVKAWTRIDGEIHQWGVWEKGDYFGEGSLLHGRRRSATITAEVDTQLLFMDQENFNWLISTYPGIKKLLEARIKTHRIARNMVFDFLGENEAIHYISRKHWYNLIATTLKPLGGFIIGLTILIIILSSIALQGVKTILSVAIGVFLFGNLFKVFWNGLRWYFNCYIITNHQVILLENILGFTTSQQAVPLSSILSVNTNTSYFGRSLNFGDIQIRTYTFSMTLMDVPDVLLSKKIIEGLSFRAKEKEDFDRNEETKQVIETALGYSEDHRTIPTELPASIYSQKRVERKGIFATRTIIDATITYHKHWIILLARTWLPATLVLTSIVMSTILISRNLQGINGITTGTVLFFAILSIGVFSLWVWYQIADWRNDVYQITRDSIIDKEKRPLGMEETNAAPIKNILSLRHVRKNLFAIILNYGDVEINIGDETIVFQNVHNPAQVQMDISIRMETLRRMNEKTKSQKDKDQLSEWIRIYHEVRADHEAIPYKDQHRPDNT
ncbi:MAG: cyclic nucleotide-binding domain-containing protein [Anaerolineales bacterium]|nr:cyclic nucleotide-binding domain-containing protein [Anaerolineales bacterium]